VLSVDDIDTDSRSEASVSGSIGGGASVTGSAGGGGISQTSEQLPARSLPSVLNRLGRIVAGRSQVLA